MSRLSPCPCMPYSCTTDPRPAAGLSDYLPTDRRMCYDRPVGNLSVRNCISDGRRGTFGPRAAGLRRRRRRRRQRRHTESFITRVTQQQIEKMSAASATAPHLHKRLAAVFKSGTYICGRLALRRPTSSYVHSCSGCSSRRYQYCRLSDP